MVALVSFSLLATILVVQHQTRVNVARRVRVRVRNSRIVVTRVVINDATKPG